MRNAPHKLALGLTVAALAATGCSKKQEQEPPAAAAKTAAATPVAPAAEPTLESVVDAHFAALGGADRWRAAKTFKYTITSAEEGADRITISRMRPNLLRAEGTKKGQPLLKIFDGQAGFVRHGDEKKKLVGDAASEMAAHAAFDDALLTYKATGLKVELAGTETVAGKPAHVVVLHHAWGDETRYIDATSKLEIQRVLAMEHEGKKSVVTHQFTDYKPINGLMVNHGLVTEKDGERHEMKVEEIGVDAELDAKLFTITDS